MVYINPSIARFSQLASVKGPALCIPLVDHEDEFFVTAGEDGYACFLGGRHTGFGLRLIGAPNITTLAMESVTVEVDLSSAYEPHLHKRPLSIVRQGDAIGLFVRTSERHQPGQTIIGVISGSLSPDHANERAAFSRWRIVHGTGDDKVVLREVDADAPVQGA